MTDLILKKIKEFGILDGVSVLTPITVGSGGAYVFSAKDANGEYIIKYMPLGGADAPINKQLEKEYNFYKTADTLNLDFIPKVVSLIKNPDEIIIVLIKYNAIPHSRWDRSLISEAASVYAKINSTDIRPFGLLREKNSEAPEPEKECYPLSVSYGNWINLAKKFPEYINESILLGIYKKYMLINDIVGSIHVPDMLCHGDFHPENCLLDGNKLIVCDWQNVCIGGVSDVLFFISRGSDMGIDIDACKFIADYHDALMKFAGVDLDISDIKKIIAASNLSCSFRFWAEYLQTSELDRILKIFDAMVKDYRFLF